MASSGPQSTELLTIAEIAKRLEIPESTVRYYRDKYPAFVPSIGRGRSRRYPAEAVAVLRFIADGLRNSVPPEAVEEGLRERFPVLVEAEPDGSAPQIDAAATQQQALAIQQQQAAVMRDILQDALRELLEEQTAVFREEIAGLHAKVDELTRNQEQQQRSSSERISELEREARRLESERDALQSQLAALRSPETAETAHDEPQVVRRGYRIPEKEEKKPWWKRMFSNTNQKQSS